MRGESPSSSHHTPYGALHPEEIGASKGLHHSKWGDPEERTLLAAMAAAGIAREEGAAVPGWNSFKPFAETIALLFGEDCSQQSIAKKVEKLLLDGPAPSGENGSNPAARFLGVHFLQQNNRWKAEIHVSGKSYSLGLYATLSEAARARDRAALAAEPAPGETFAQHFNFPDEAAELVSPDGALHPLSSDAEKGLKKIYAARSKGGVASMHPTMLALWGLHSLGLTQTPDEDTL